MIMNDHIIPFPERRNYIFKKKNLTFSCVNYYQQAFSQHWPLLFFLHKGKTIFKTKANTSKTALLLKLHLKGTSLYSTLNNNNNQFGIFLKTKCQDYNDVYTKHATYEILQFFHIEMMPFGHLFNTRSWFQHIFSPRFRFAQEPGSMCRWPWPVTPPILPPPVKQNMKKKCPLLLSAISRASRDYDHTHSLGDLVASLRGSHLRCCWLFPLHHCSAAAAAAAASSPPTNPPFAT